MLAMANKNGFVFASVPGLADRARVPLEAAVMALERFQQPDEWSRTKEFDGRRIEPVDGGWRLLNYQKHRSIRDEEDRREYMRLLMRKKRKSVSKNVSNVSHSKPPLAQAEAEAEAEADKVKVSLRKAKQATLISDEFIPKDEHYSLAAELGINCDMEFQKFRDHFLGVGGPKAYKRDWDATLRNWLRNSLRFGGRTNGREPTKAEQRVINSRRNILIALGDIPTPGASSAGVSVGDPTGPDEGLAGYLPRGKR